MKTRSTAQIRTHAQKFVIKACNQYGIRVFNNNFDEAKKQLDRFYPSTNKETNISKTVILTFKNYIPGYHNKDQTIMNHYKCYNCGVLMELEDSAQLKCNTKQGNGNSYLDVLQTINNFTITKTECFSFEKNQVKDSNSEINIDLKLKEEDCNCSESYKHCGCKNLQIQLEKELVSLSDNVNALINILEKSDTCPEIES
jgi:hypothetical protein